jgi:hypothetical protein
MSLTIRPVEPKKPLTPEDIKKIQDAEMLKNIESNQDTR